MARWKRIEERLKRRARDITFDEIKVLLEHYGYRQDNSGKTSGSRIRFVMDGKVDILLHKPHPQKELKGYVINDLCDMIRTEGFWNE